ncbi:MAG: pyridoxamine 5'-phosphate oxidase family protein [Pseudomonadota bacterium]
MQDLKARFVAELNRRRVLSIATLRPDGWPQATIVGFVNDGTAIYFIISRESQKYANLKADPRVSICLGEDVARPEAITGASMAATVAEVKDPAERQRVLALMLLSYPEYASMMDEVDSARMAIMRATPLVVSVLTYEQGFGHTDTLDLRTEAAVAA